MRSNRLGMNNLHQPLPTVVPPLSDGARTERSAGAGITFRDAFRLGRVTVVDKNKDAGWGVVSRAASIVGLVLLT